MIGAIIGDLAAWTWENDHDVFYPHLVSDKAVLSQYSKTILDAYDWIAGHIEATSTPFIKDNTDGDVAQISPLLYAIVVGWIFGTEEATMDAVHKYCRFDEKEAFYACHFLALLIFSLRNGATKNEAAQVEFIGTFKQLMEGGHWDKGYSELPYLIRAWSAFYDSFDYGSTIHRAVQQSGDRHLNCILAGALADAMYGCSHYFIKKKYGGGGGIIDVRRFVPDEMWDTVRKQRIFFPKNEALTNVDIQEWETTTCPYQDKLINEELHRRILKAFVTGWDNRYGFYLDDGWVYVYRSGFILSRFQLDKAKDGYRMVNYQQTAKEKDTHPLDEAMYAVEHQWYLYSGEKDSTNNNNLTDNIMEPDISIPSEQKVSNLTRKLLKECRVAGIVFHNIEDVWDELYEGAKIALVRQCNNEHDKNAVAVALIDDYDGNPDDFDFDYILGYIPREENEEIATILDMGWQDSLEAEISLLDRKRPMADRLHISIYVKNKCYDAERSKLLRVANLDDEALKNFNCQLTTKGFAFYRWTCLCPPGGDEPDLPERGNKVVFMHKYGGKATLYLLYTLASNDDEAELFVKNEQQLHCIDDCKAFVLTNIIGPTQISVSELAFLDEENIGWREPNQCLGKEDSKKLLSFFNIPQE